MSFMQPEIVHCHFQIVNNTNEGDIACPESDSMYRGNEDAAKAYGVSVDDVKTVLGWGYRLQSPGYLDATEWGVADTEADAIRELLDEYGDDDNADWIPEAVERLLELAETDEERNAITQEYGDPSIPNEPEECDYITEDGSVYFADGKEVCRVEDINDPAEPWRTIDESMKREGFYPNVWSLSDHGNYCLMTRSE